MEPGKDGLLVQCVGSWAENKHYFLERHLNATKYVRKKFSVRNNSVFIDLFSGPGKCIIRNEEREIDSGGVIPLNLDIPFNEYYYFDISQENFDTLKKRLIDKPYCHTIHGDSNYLIKDLVNNLFSSNYKYHFAYIDPFGPDNLKFNTLKELSRLKRIDMLIHFPIGAIKRNINNWLNKSNTILDEFLGTNKWREKISQKPKQDYYIALLQIFEEQLKSIGYKLKMASSDISITKTLRTVPIKNTKERELYALIHVSKDPIGQKIWNSITEGPDQKGQAQIKIK